VCSDGNSNKATAAAAAAAASLAQKRWQLVRHQALWDWGN